MATTARTTVLDETGGLDIATINASTITGLFNNDSSYGEDGAGTTVYTLNNTGNANTGLYLTGDNAGNNAANEISISIKWNKL